MKKIVSLIIAILMISSLVMTASASEPESNPIENPTVYDAIAETGFILVGLVGNWETEFKMTGDGFFEGFHDDADLGIQTKYHCDFKGVFSEPEPVDEYTYKVTLISLEESTFEPYVNEYGTTVKPTTAFGLNIGDTFELYTPDKPVAELPADYPDRLFLPSTLTSLGFWCFNNMNQNVAFHSVPEDKETTDAETENETIVQETEPATIVQNAETEPVVQETETAAAGWLQAIEEPQAATDPATIFYVNPINDYINVRSQPAHNSDLVGTVQFYDEMYFYGETATGYGSDGLEHFWYKISTNNGITGWVRSDLVSTVPNTSYTIRSYTDAPVSIFYVDPINSYINVRSQPAHNSNLVGTVQIYEVMYFYGETATGYGSDGLLHYWYKIVSNSGVTGWVRSDLVSVIASSYNMNYNYSASPMMVLYVYPGNTYLNVRTQPNHYSYLAGTVQSYEDMYFYGETATGLGSDGYIHLWYKVTTSGGVTGWVRSDLVGTLYYN